MNTPIDILLGGVPFGRNNAGDEAILECTVDIIRECCPSARITVSTDARQETRDRLRVETVPLFGFEAPYRVCDMRACIAAADVFIWAGATGLSDYPDIPLRMLEIAHRVGTHTIVWGVGMSSELNPNIYRFLPGRRRRLLDGLSRLVFQRVDFVNWMEGRILKRVQRRIVMQLNRCDLVILRDPETLTAVQACGPVANAFVGADPAERLNPVPWQDVALTVEARRLLESSDRKIGLCISAQRRIVHEEELIGFLDRLAGQGYYIVFLPMNHATDADVMQGFHQRMRHRDRALVIQGRRSPGEILAIAGTLDLVISSRLHLLILASVLHVPIIGISRGSKVDNFLAPFGHVSAGSVEACDFEHMQQELDRLIDARDEFAEISMAVHAMLLERLELARKRLARMLERVAEEKKTE